MGAFSFLTMLVLLAAPKEPPKATLTTPQAEVLAASKHLGTFAVADQPYIKYFSSYALTEESRQANDLVLPFVLNSVHYFEADGDICRPKEVPGSQTLVWIDIRDFGWTPEQFLKVTQSDPYFQQPWIANNTNLVVRTDWFNCQATDLMLQKDVGNPNLLYYVLTYGDKVPKNAKEFQDAWGIDLAQAEKLSTPVGAIVDQGNSGVSRHNRLLRRIRTPLGYYYDTFDVGNHEGARDYVERPPILEPTIVHDASELITNNRRNLQTYLLVNAEGNRIDDADPKFVIDNSDDKDKRVRTAKSCIFCHANGLNPASKDAIEELRTANIKIKIQKKEDYLKFQRFHQTGRFNELVEEDNASIFAKAVKRCNGLKPDQNLAAFRVVYNDYIAPLTMEMCARECGVTKEEFVAKCRQSVSSRLNLAVSSPDGVIPRGSWEKKEAGLFAVSMLLINKLDPPKVVVSKPQIRRIKVVKEKCAVVDGDGKAVGELAQGAELTYTEVKPQYYVIQYNGTVAYVQKDFCEELK